MDWSVALDYYMLMDRCNFNSFMSRSGLMRHLLFIITHSMNYDEKNQIYYPHFVADKILSNCIALFFYLNKFAKYTLFQARI